MAGVDHRAETICLDEGHLIVSGGVQGRDMEEEEEEGDWAIAEWITFAGLRAV